MTEGPELGSSDMSSPVTASPQSNVETATVTSVIGAESVGAVSGERGSGATVRLEGVTKRYAIDKDVVIMAADDVNLDFAAGSSTALMGASGSGKSTLLHLMGAMDTPTSGRIFIRWAGDHGAERTETRCTSPQHRVRVPEVPPPPCVER